MSDYYHETERLRQAAPEFFRQGIELERQLFGGIFDDALNEADYIASGDTTVLIPACGYCVEAPVVTERLRDASSPESRVQIIGIDKERVAIEAAREDSAAQGHLFIEGDARDLGQYAEISRAVVDLVLIRRQNSSFVSQGWPRIFESAMEQLRPAGLAIVTSQGMPEHKMMLNAFRELGCAPEHTGRTRYWRRSLDNADEWVRARFPIEHTIATFRKQAE